MTINEIITLHDAELYIEYDQQSKIYTLGVSISELQEKISDCLYFKPCYSKNTSNTVAIDIYYCDSNNEEHYIVSTPSFSFRLRQFEVYNLVALINYIEHGNN